MSAPMSPPCYPLGHLSAGPQYTHTPQQSEHMIYTYDVHHTQNKRHMLYHTTHITHSTYTTPHHIHRTHAHIPMLSVPQYLPRVHWNSRPFVSGLTGQRPQRAPPLLPKPPPASSPATSSFCTGQKKLQLELSGTQASQVIQCSQASGCHGNCPWN